MSSRFFMTKLFLKTLSFLRESLFLYFTGLSIVHKRQKLHLVKQERIGAQ